MNRYFSNENIDKIERMINLIKPKFYNKLTWLIVGTGLTIIAKPLWIEILNTILNKKYQLNITDENDIFIGLLLVIIALIYNLITVYFDKFLIFKQASLKEKDISKKDRELFNKFLLDLPTEGTIEFLRDNDFYNIFRDSNIESLYKIERFWNNAEYKFINLNVELLKIQLIEKIDFFLKAISEKTIYSDNFEFRQLNKTQNTYEQNMKDAKFLNDLADDVYNSHQNFIIESNKELN